MAVVNAYQSWSGSGSISIGSGANTFDGSFEDIWTVLCDDPATALADAYASASVPALHSVHPDFAFAQLSQKTFKLLGPILVEVTCQYAGQNSPLLEPYERSGGGVTSREAIETDSTGALIANALGDRITGIEEDIPDWQETITRNEATKPTTVIRDYLGAISNDIFMGWAAGEAKMQDIKTQYVTKKGATWYYRCTYVIGFRRSVAGVPGWKRRFVNHGLRYWTGKRLTGGAKQILTCTDDSGQPVSQPRKLDADGKLLAEGAADVFIEAWTRPLQPFNALGLAP